MSDTTTITPEERANLRRLAGAATPRPWKMRKHCDESAHMEVADSVGIVCTTPFYGFEYPEQWTNGEYIAAACNSVPRLLTALEAAEARAEKAESDKAALEEDLEAAEKNLKEFSGFIEELLSGLKHRFPCQYAYI